MAIFSLFIFLLSRAANYIGFHFGRISGVFDLRHEGQIEIGKGSQILRCKRMAGGGRLLEDGDALKSCVLE